MAFSTFSKLIDELPALHAIYLSGGEPFEHPELLRFVSLAKKAATRVIVYSSGTVRAGLQPSSVDPQKLAAATCAGVDRVDISLYAASPEQHDRVTQVAGSFEATVKTLHCLRTLGIPFGVHYVPIANSGANLLAVFGLARSFGAARFHVLSLAPQGRARHLATEKPSSSFYEDVRELWERDPPGLRLVLSSSTRGDAQIDERTPRDSLRAAMLDVSGYLYPGEGKRQQDFRTKLSLTTGAEVSDVLRELLPS